MINKIKQRYAILIVMYDVITIGTVTKDVFLRVPEDKICFEPGSKTDIGAPMYAVGGGAANAAVLFARQGLKTAALFRAGADREGNDIIHDLKKEGIECWDSRAHETSTGHSTIFLFPSGERSIVVYRGASETMPLEIIPFTTLKAKWVYIAPSHISVSVMEKIINHCYCQGIAVAMNPSRFYLEQKAKRLKPLLNQINVLIVNRDEAVYLTGMPREREKDIFARLDALIDGIAVMTDGPRGAWISDGKQIYQAGIFASKKVIDRTGAGDAFGSGFVAGMAMKENIEYALRLGSANATSVVETMGAHTGALTRSAFEKERRWKKVEIKTMLI